MFRTTSVFAGGEERCALPSSTSAAYAQGGILHFTAWLLPHLQLSPTPPCPALPCPALILNSRLD